MSVVRFVRRSPMPADAAALFAWHARPGAFDRLVPPWEGARLVSTSAVLADGARWEIHAPAPLGLPERWVAEIRDVRAPSQHGPSAGDGSEPERHRGPPDLRAARRSEASGLHGGEAGGFRDVQVSGPFRRWEHTHLFEPCADGTSVLEDRIEFELPFGAIGAAFGRRAALARIERMFAYRHAVVRDDLARMVPSSGVPPMRVVVTGASGLIGSALVPLLSTSGHDVVRAVRGRALPGEVLWDPVEQRMDPSSLDGADAVVHLAGESIAAGRWTPEIRRRIRASRVDGSALIARTLARMPRPPRVLVQASAVGFYGDRGDEILSESAPRGAGFLAEVCEAWERAAEPARDAGIRTVFLRTGVVLTPRGGALAKMLPPFRAGVGGVIGSGRQWMPWISIDDLAGAALHALTTDALDGPVNAVAPNPATNREFTKALGRALGRPTLFPLPAFAARLALGEMADELLLASTRAVPAKLDGSGFVFRHRDLSAALGHVLGRRVPM